MISIGTLGQVVGVGTYFEAFRDCEALPRDQFCSVRRVTSCFPASLTPETPVANAGIVNLSDGTGTATATPDNLGIYTGAPAQLDLSRPLKLVAAGGTIPAFEAEIVFPRESVTLEVPAPSSTIRGSEALTVGWSGEGNAQFVSVAIQDVGVGARSIECDLPPIPTRFEIGSQFTSALLTGKSVRISAALANVTRLSVGDWTINVVAAGSASGYPIETAP